MTDTDRLTAIEERAEELRTTLASWSDPVRIATARIAELESALSLSAARIAQLTAENDDLRIELKTAQMQVTDYRATLKRLAGPRG